MWGLYLVSLSTYKSKYISTSIYIYIYIYIYSRLYI
jgi:hypothetical protein